MEKKLAQIFGQVNPPPGVSNYGDITTPGPVNFITNILRLIIVLASVYAVFNLVLAGYAFMSAGRDPKKIADAWAKIWQTLLGLAFSVGAFLLAAIFGKLLFGEYNALLELRIFGP